MIDNYAMFGIMVRLVAGTILAIVIVKQLQQFKYSNQLDYIKRLLLTTSIVLFAGNFLAIIINMFRAEDGNLIETARHFGTVFNSTATLLVSITLYLIYKYKIDEGDE